MYLPEEKKLFKGSQRTGQRVLLYGMLYYGVSNRKAQREAYLRAHQAKIAGKPRVQIVV
jgi:hypothetical protein